MKNILTQAAIWMKTSEWRAARKKGMLKMDICSCVWNFTHTKKNCKKERKNSVEFGAGWERRDELHHPFGLVRISTQHLQHFNKIYIYILACLHLPPSCTITPHSATVRKIKSHLFNDGTNRKRCENFSCPFRICICKRQESQHRVSSCIVLLQCICVVVVVVVVVIIIAVNIVGRFV